MSIYDNAIGSIKVGVEDYNMSSHSRQLSAVRSVTAGILLLYKEKLARLSPPHDKEALIKKTLVPSILPDGTVSIIGKGKNTVDFHEIKDRFIELGVNVDWTRLERLRKLRNDVEHYYTSLSPDNVRELLAVSMVLIRDFLVNELVEEPLDALGESCWKSLLTVGEVYETEKKECRETFEKIHWKYESLGGCFEYFRCGECHSSLIRTDETGEYYVGFQLSCVSCGHHFTADEVMEAAVEELLSGEAYLAAKDGQEPPYTKCSDCDQETFILGEGVCISCEAELYYKNCLRCCDSLSVDDQEFDGMCGYCKHMADKVMYD